MLGYSNPWATLLRKQCEASPVAIQGLYDLVLSLLVDVPFAKCMCVDAAEKGSNFQRCVAVVQWCFCGWFVTQLP